MSPADFRAVSTCPRCGHIAYHWVDEPPDALPWAKTATGLPTYAPGGDMTAHHINTSNSSVMRTCRQCEHAWGEH